MYSDRSNRGEKLSSIKSTAVQYGILVMMLALAAGLWRLQVLGASSYRDLAQQNRIRKVPIMAPRGKLFDREDRLLVDNYPSVSCFLVREQNKNLDADLPMIAQGLHLDLEQLRSTLKHFRAAPATSRFPSSRTFRPTKRPLLRRTATSCRSWRPSTKSAACIRGTASPRTSSGMWGRSARMT